MEEEGMFEKAFRQRKESLGGFDSVKSIESKPIVSNQINKQGRPMTAKQEYEELKYRQKINTLQQPMPRQEQRKESYKTRAMNEESKLNYRLSEMKYKAKLKSLKKSQDDLTKAQIKNAIGDVKRGAKYVGTTTSKGVGLAQKGFSSLKQKFSGKRKSIYK